jgi:hypothetical protein
MREVGMSWGWCAQQDDSPVQKTGYSGFYRGKLSMKIKYANALNSIPAPGTGSGCHGSLLSAANYGVMAKVEPQRIHDDIRSSIPYGGRTVSDREISDTIRKALSDHKGGDFTPQPRPKPVVSNGKAALQKIISQANINTDVDLWESSPIRLLDDLKHDTALFLETLYKLNDFIFIGDRIQAGILGDTIRRAGDWINYFENDGKTAPHIVINPLTGMAAPTKSGDKETMRGDGCVKDFRFCLVEFDDLSREDQIRFWCAVKLPICALIDSGGKSIHGWLDVKKLSKVETAEQWESEIKGRLYERILKPLGVDGACSNPARLSRLPGHFRNEKSMQKILWLSPEGRSIENVNSI